MNNLYFVSEGLNDEFYDYFKTKNLAHYLIRKEDLVYDAIASHPDIYLFSTGDQLIVAPNKYSELNKLYGNRIIKGESLLKFKYPHTIYYNAVLLGDYIIHNFKFTDDIIKKFAERNNLVQINVNQGYTKCNVAIIDENSIITSDQGIYNEVNKYKINALLIQPGHIKLQHMNYGFIGGCCGIIEGDLIFYGNITEHPDFEKIYEFVKKRNVKMKWFDFPLEDIGSILKLTIK